MDVMEKYVFGGSIVNKIVIVDPIDESGINILKHNYNGQVIFKKEEIKDEIIKEAQAIIVRVYPLTGEMISECRKLKVIGKHGVGVDNINISMATKKCIPVTFTPVSNSQSVAEHAISLMMGLAKNTLKCHNSTTQGNFEDRSNLRNAEMYKTVLGLVGAGNIGSRVGKMCSKAFNMKVMVYDPYLDNCDWGEKTEHIEEIFQVADYISVHVTLNNKTKNIVSEKLLNIMKESAVIINTSRGGLIDEEALIDVLVKRKIGGAGLDVFKEEPVKIDNPLLKMNNVLLSPHMGGITTVGLKRMAMDVANNVLSILAGDKSVPLINPEVWD